MSDDAHALKVYELALTLMEAKGVFITVGLTKLREYRTGSLIVRNQPPPGGLEVWSVGKVLSIKRDNDTLRVLRYRPGDWEQEIIADAEKKMD